jgi:hypothetical protein
VLEGKVPTSGTPGDGRKISKLIGTQVVTVMGHVNVRVPLTILAKVPEAAIELETKAALNGRLLRSRSVNVVSTISIVVAFELVVTSN